MTIAIIEARVVMNILLVIARFRWLSDREKRIADLPNKATLLQVVQERQDHPRTEFRDSNLFGH